jgi:ATP-dependent RNA helicase RhlE
MMLFRLSRLAPRKAHTLTSFETLGLSQYLLNTLSAAGFETPTPIQAQAIPHLLEGRDLIGLAQTGTGKTLGFGLPIIARLIKEGTSADPKSCRALILAPTRELVNQIAESLKVFTRKSPLKITTVVGGASINVQSKILEKGIDILVATPGRLLDLCDRRALNLTATRYLVLDEADQMLDLGFIHDLKKIVKMVPKRRQTMLFSATMPQAIAELAQDYLTDPVEVSVTPPGKAADKVEQRVHFVLGRDHKSQLLKDELNKNADGLSLVFCKTKHGAEKLMKHLDHTGLNVASIHGNKSQGQRDRALKGFRDGDIQILVATDVAARGIDVPGISYVYNYDLPNVPDTYVHRIGRTARAGRDGVAIAFCGPEDIKLLYDIEKLLGLPIPVASGERPAWQGKQKVGGGEGHRGRRPESRGPREEREQQQRAAEKQENRQEQENRQRHNDRRPRPQSSFAEVEELSGGEFRPVRTDRRDDERHGQRGNGSQRHQHQGNRPPRGEQQTRGERLAPGPRPAHADHPTHGQTERPARPDHALQADRPARNEERPRGNRPQRNDRPAHADHRGNRNHAEAKRNDANRHSPARHAGFADDRNVIGNDAATEARPARKPHRDGQPNANARPAGGSKPFHGGNRNDNRSGGNGGQRRAGRRG